ncbi:unnamed protein product [Linum trigynum]|uniref:Uncharacterized protein n=1 Tax=Linum trigynum TaxID=586398 RepID=A0AAV2FWK5_9ROSI
MKQRQGQPPSQAEPQGAGRATADDQGAGAAVAVGVAVAAGSSLEGGGAAAAVKVMRPGFGLSGPNIEAGLLPTPTAQELAARKGKGKMPGYDTDGPLTTNGPEMVGRFARDDNGLGWLGLDDEAEDDRLNLGDRWADPVMDQRSCGPSRVADPVGRMGSAPIGQTWTGWTVAGRPKGGRTEPGRPEGRRTKPVMPEWVEPSLDGPIWVGPTWVKLGIDPTQLTSHREERTKRGPRAGKGRMELQKFLEGTQTNRAAIRDTTDLGNPNRGQGYSHRQPWRTPV